MIVVEICRFLIIVINIEIGGCIVDWVVSGCEYYLVVSKVVFLV